MKTFIAFIIVSLFSFQIKAEQQPKGNHISRILGNSKDISLPNIATQDIRSVDWKAHKGIVEVQVKEGGTEVFDIHHFWGYQQDDMDIYRFFEGTFYKVEQMGKLWVYSQENYVGASNNMLYFFSETPESPIFWMSRQNLKMVFHENNCMMQHLEQLSWTKPIAAFSKKDKTFMIERWLDECQPK